MSPRRTTSVRPRAMSAWDLVGRDLARVRLAPTGRRSFWIAGLLAMLIAALALVSLRNDLVRVRYGLADAIEAEKGLLEQRRALQARVRELRNPQRLAELARKRGLGRPERIVELRGGGMRQ